MGATTDPTQVLDRVTARLHARHERMTPARRSIVTALASTEGHLDADEITRAVGQLDPTVNRSTVYRALESLSSLGVVQHIHLPHGRTMYHLLADTEEHPHAQCRRCGAVFDLPSDVLEETARRLAQTSGFTLDATHVALSGTCRECRQSDRSCN